MKLARIIIGIDSLAATVGAWLVYSPDDDCWLWLLALAAVLAAGTWLISRPEVGR